MSAAGWPGVVGARPIKFGRLVLYSMDDIRTLPQRKYVVKGLFAPNELGLLVGPPKCGKSFLALHIAYAVAQGRDLFGRRVHQARALYVAAEGELGIARRLVALESEYGSTDGFYLIAQRADLLNGDGSNTDRVALIQAARATGAGLIVIDTLNRAFGGGDENSSEDMGAFIDNLSELREATLAHVLIVHHGTKSSEGRTPRGHSSLAGAVDTIVEITKAADGNRLASIVAAKDDADGVDMGFRLKPAVLGQDDDGDPITTLLVEELTTAPRSAPKLSVLRRSVRNAVANLIAGHGMPLPRTDGFPSDRSICGAREVDVLTECEARNLSAAEKLSNRRQNYKQALVALQGFGQLAMRQGWVWLP